MNVKTGKLKTFIVFLFLVFISFTPLLWFKNDFLIAGGDHTLYLNPSILVERSKYVWDEVLNMGKSNLTCSHVFPYGYFWYFFQKLGLNNVLIEKIWFILIWFATSFFVYRLTSYLVGSFKYSQIAGIFAVLIYQFNPYKMIDVLDVPRLLTYMVLPLLIYLFMRGLESKKNSYIVYFALSTLLFSSAWVNPPMATITLISLFIYFLYLLIIEREGRKENVLYAGKLMLFTGLINIWWILPYVFLLNESVGEIKKVVSTFSPLGAYLYEVFRFMGLWAFRMSHYLMNYYPYYRIYYFPPMIFLTYLIPLLSFFPFLYLRNLDKKIFFFYLLYTIGIFLSAGKVSALGILYQLFYSYLPGFWIFRDPYAKFTPLNVLSISILFGITLMFFFHLIDDKIFHFRKNIFLKVAITGIFIGVIFITAFPLITGDCIWKYWNGSMRSSYVKIPKYWFRMGRWFLKNDPYSRIFVTPKSGYGKQAYNWMSGISTGTEGLIMYFTPNPYLIHWDVPIFPSYKLVNFLYSDYFLKSKDVLYKTLSLFAVRYILQKNDLDWRFAYSDTYSPFQMRRILNSQEKIFFIKSFGELDLYKLSEKYFLPHIYLSLPTVIYSDINTFIPVTNTKYLDNEPLLVFIQQNKNLNIKDQILIKAANFVFKDNNWWDLLMQVKSYTVGNAQVDIKKSGIYEIYLNILKVNKDRNSGVGNFFNSLKINIDGKEVFLFNIPKNNVKDQEYIKIGEVDLEKGKHNIKIKSQKSKMFSGCKSTLNREIQNTEIEKIEIILVNKEEKKELEKQIRQKINGFKTELCYIFEEKKGEFFIN